MIQFRRSRLAAVLCIGLLVASASSASGMEKNKEHSLQSSFKATKSSIWKDPSCFDLLVGTSMLGYWVIFAIIAMNVSGDYTRG